MAPITSAEPATMPQKPASSAPPITAPLSRGLAAARLDHDLAVNLDARQFHVVAGANGTDAAIDVGPHHVARMRAPDVASRVELLDDYDSVDVHGTLCRSGASPATVPLVIRRDRCCPLDLLRWVRPHVRGDPPRGRPNPERAVRLSFGSELPLHERK